MVKNNKMKKIIAAALSCAIIAGGMSGCSNNAEPSIEDAEKRDNVVVASLDGVDVTLSDYVYWYRMNQMGMEQEAVGSGHDVANLADYWKTDLDGVTNAQSLRNTSLIDAKHYAMLIKLANDAGTTLDEAAAEERSQLIDETVAALDEDPTKAAQSFFETYGSTPNQMKRLYLGMEMINQYIADLEENMVLTEAELKAEYDAHPEEYDMVTVRHVLVLCGEGASKEDKDAAIEKAEDILRQVNEGADIGELAKEFSEDTGSVDNNGEYTFGRGEMVKEFEDWAYAASAGDTGVVQTSYGYHVMYSMPKPGFSELSEMVRSALLYERINAILDECYQKAEQAWDENEEALNSINPDKAMIEDSASQSQA